MQEQWGGDPGQVLGVCPSADLQAGKALPPSQNLQQMEALTLQSESIEAIPGLALDLNCWHAC